MYKQALVVENTVHCLESSSTCTVNFDPIIIFVAGTYTETSTEGKAARDATCRSSTESETSTKRKASRNQAGLGRESKQSTTPRATRTQSNECTLAGLKSIYVSEGYIHRSI